MLPGVFACAGPCAWDLLYRLGSLSPVPKLVGRSSIAPIFQVRKLRFGEAEAPSPPAQWSPWGNASSMAVQRHSRGMGPRDPGDAPSERSPSFGRGAKREQGSCHRPHGNSRPPAPQRQKGEADVA